MNKLSGKIIFVESSTNVSIVDVEVHGDVFTSIVVETPDTATYLKAGQPVTILFKETEVSIAKNLSGMISLRNRFSGKIKSIQESKVLSMATLDYKNKNVVSIISTRSVQKLNLKAGDAVEWLVKSNEVYLAQEGSL